MAGNARIRITAEDRTRAAVATAKRNFQGFEKSLKGVYGALGLTTAALGIYLAQQSKVITESKKFAEQLNISTQSLNELAYAFGVEGNINAEQFADSLQGLNSRLGEAAVTGGGPLVEAFQALGLNIREVRSLNTDDMILEISKAFEKLDDAQKETFLSAELFEGEAEKLITLLRKGPKEIERLTKEYRELAGVISEAEAAKIANMTKAWKDMKVALDGLAVTVLSLVSEDATEWIEKVTKSLSSFSKWVDSNKDVFNFLIGMTPFGGYDSYSEAWDGASDSIQDYIFNLQMFVINEKIANSTSKELTDNLMQQRKEMKRINDERLRSQSLVTVPKGTDKPELPELPVPLLDEAGFRGALKQDEKQMQAVQSVIDQQMAMKRAMFEADLEGMQNYWDEFNNQNEVAADKFDEKWGSVIGSFSQGVGDAFASAIVDQESLGKGLQSVMRMVAKEVISSLIKIGVQKAIQSTFSKALIASETAAGVASGAALTSAYAPAAAAASVATGGGAALAGSTLAIASIGAITGAILGQAHDGLDYVPQTGTYLLEKGERVVKKEDNKAMMAGGMGNTYNFTIQAMDTQTGVDFLMKNENAIVSMIQDKYDSRGEKGGPMR